MLWKNGLVLQLQEEAELKNDAESLWQESERSTKHIILNGYFSVIQKLKDEWFQA